MLYRHGDVFVANVESIPRTAEKLPHCTLAEGELTGHSHRIRESNAAELFRHNGQLFLRVLNKTATLVHQEHGPIALPRGDYRVWIQREYTPQAIRRVID